MDRRAVILSTLSLALAVLSIAAAVWFYFAGKRDRRLSYAVGPERARIVNATNIRAKGLGVVYNGEPVLDSDVTSITVYLWNDGKESIRRENVLLPIQIRLGKGAAVLDCQLLRSPRRDITRFADPSYRPGSQLVSLDWDILERGDGATVQVIFSGPYDASVGIIGAVEGQTGLRAVAEPASREGTSFLDRSAPVVALLAVFVVMAFFAVWEHSDCGKVDRFRVVMLAALGLLTVGYCALGALVPAIPASLVP